MPTFSPLAHRFLAAAVFCCAAPLFADQPDLPDAGKKVDLLLTILHANDAQSQLLESGPNGDFAGAARFTTLMHRLKTEAAAPTELVGRKVARDSIVLSAGNNISEGLQFYVSLSRGFPYLDSKVMTAVRYDAVALGNDEFDFGPNVLARLIQGVSPHRTKFVSANLDVRHEPRLRNSQRVARSTVITKKGRRIGIIGATTPSLPIISSPGKVIVRQNVRREVQREINHLRHRGVEILLLLSNMGSLEADRELVAQLRGIDLVVSSGGRELLANKDALLIPGDKSAGPYPLFAQDAEERAVPIVTTSGGYGYVGRLVVGFSRYGELALLAADQSGPIRVAGGGQPDAVPRNRKVKRAVIDELRQGIKDLAKEQAATTEVGLDGRAKNLRTRETNLGDLVADALLDRVRQAARAANAPAPTVAIENGGGIDLDASLPAGPITELDTVEILPFLDTVGVVENVPPAQFKEILENGVSEVEELSGRFPQIAGFRFTFTRKGRAQRLSANGNVLQSGRRILEVQLDTGEYIVRNGSVVSGAPSVNIATNRYLARGGDGYPFRTRRFYPVSLTDQSALHSFLLDLGVVRATDYPTNGLGRIREQ